MARDVYRDIIAIQDASGFLKALNGVEITVFVGGTYDPAGDTGTLAQVFQTRTGASQGPSPNAGASGGPNPFTTGATGAVETWLEAGLYDIRIKDITGAPPRISTRWFQWQSAPAVPGGLPTSFLADDGGITLAKIAADILRQMTVIGEVIDWFRPANTVPVPSGFVVCDGQSVAASAHDFGTGASFNTPDLRNKFVLGANIANADGAGATVGEAAANAPGIRGVGGTNFKDLSHYHLTNDHTHTVLPHTHPIPHTHQFTPPNHDHNVAGTGEIKQFHVGTGSGTFYAFTTSYGGATQGSNQWSTAGTTAGVSTPNSGSSASAQTGTTSDRGTSTQLSNQQDFRSAWVGLLKIMKVKRS
jgi:hypothetical protein